MKRLSSLMVAVACMCLATTGFAQLAPLPSAKSKTYIVLLKGDPIIAYEGGEQGLPATKPGKGKKVNPNSNAFKKYAAHLEQSQQEVLSSVGDAEQVYSYKVALNGFAASLSEGQVEVLKSRDDVLAIYEDRLMKPQTNTTPNFLGLTQGGQAWSKGYVGEDVVIGILDSGIQPDHPSLADVPTPKKGNKGPKIPYGAPPASWSGTGCEFGTDPGNPNDTPFTCNNKLLKAEFYIDGFNSAGNPLAAGSAVSALDTDGHGTHTATTAGGNFGVPASVGGVDFGTVSGIAPRARVAIYKVCWDAVDPDDSGCFSSDSAAAIDQAVVDGVDAINFSIGGASNNFGGPDDIAFLFAQDAGVWVATSAGNAGPGAGTIGTPSGVPWITAVGASEDDENFGTGLDVSAPAEIAKVYEGLEGNGDVALADTGDIVSNVVPSVPANGCSALTNGADIAGNIALVIRGGCSFTTKYNSAAAAGALAIVVYNDGTGEDRVDPITMSAPGTTIPGIMIRFPDGITIANAAALDTVTGRLSPDIAVSRVNRITGFSSRGPNNGALDVIKPDVAAPGVGILAGEVLFPDANNNGGEFFAFLSGTSMASPHVAGAFGLLKEAHPDWTAAQARSALMTTARQDLRKTFGELAADPFDIGAGQIVPSAAFDPGLTYDAGILDYLSFMCVADEQSALTSQGFCDDLAAAGFPTDPSDLNLPSIAIGALAGSQTVTRTVTSVAPGNRPFRAVVEAPAGVDVSVNPSVIQIKTGESATYEITFDVTDAAVLDEWTFGSITWTDDDRYDVRSPIAVQPVALAAPNGISGTGTSGSESFTVQFGYEGAYEANMDGLTEAAQFPGAVADGDADLFFFTVPAGTTLTRVSLFDSNVGAGDGSDDLDLQVFGPDTAGFPFLGSSGSATSEEQFDIENPAPGTYAFFVIDFASAPGPTPYTAFTFNLDGTDAGNTTITAPASATLGASETVTVDWSGLNADTRYLGRITHSDGVDDLATTEVAVDTQ